jgi:hypothetical protein
MIGSRSVPANLVRAHPVANNNSTKTALTGNPDKGGLGFPNSSSRNNLKAGNKLPSAPSWITLHLLS